MTKTVPTAYNLLKANPFFWGKHVCKEHFRNASAPFHLQIINEAVKNRFFAVASPRGSAKSTLVAFLLPLHYICFRKKHFILIVSNTYKKAAGSLDTIKREITDNPVLKEYHQIKIVRDAEGDSIFEHADGFKIRVLCKGNEQLGSVRGEKFGAYRPDLIIIDDLEDDELVRNPERRIYLKELYDEALIPAGDKETYEVKAIGTVLHDDSLIAKLVDIYHYPEYFKLFYQARRKNGTSLWPDKWSLDELNKLEKLKPTVFAKEYQNDPVSGLLSKFKKTDFRYWTIDNDCYVLFGEDGRIVSQGKLYDCKAAIACDLAWGERKENDFGVIMPAFLTPKAEILVDRYVCEKGLKPNAIEEHLFTMEKRLRLLTGSSVFIGFEKAQLEKVMKWLLKQAMQRRNHYLMFKDLMWDKDKITRIVTRLQPRYAQQSIFHKRNMGELEHQLLRVPSGTHDDLPDALQGLVQLLQHPKRKGKAIVEDTQFEFMRKLAINSRRADRKRFTFGNKGKFNSIPAKVSPW